MMANEGPKDWRSEHDRSARSDDAPQGARPSAAGGFPALGGGGRGVGEFEIGCTPELRAFASESWFTQSGARSKYRRLMKAGLPNFKNWRFITLTMYARNLSPIVAYERGKDRIRRFLARMRVCLGRPFKWCWKLEFQDDGYAHWHLLIEYRKRIPQESLPRLEQWWGLGRVNVRRVLGSDIRYVFKYVAKGIDEIPEWVLRYKGRFRVFQACRGFYTKRRGRVHVKREPRSCLMRVDLRTRLGYDERRALLVTVNQWGQRRARCVKIRSTFRALLVERANEAIRVGRQLDAPGAITLTQRQVKEIENEHKRYAGLACIPQYPHAA